MFSKRVVAAVLKDLASDKDFTWVELQKKHGVSRSTLYRLMKSNGVSVTLYAKGRRSILKNFDNELMRQDILAYPSSYLKERGYRLGLSTFLSRKVMKQLDYTKVRGFRVGQRYKRECIVLD